MAAAPKRSAIPSSVEADLRDQSARKLAGSSSAQHEASYTDAASFSDPWPVRSRCLGPRARTRDATSVRQLRLLWRSGFSARDHRSVGCLHTPARYRPLQRATQPTRHVHQASAVARETYDIPFACDGLATDITQSHLWFQSSLSRCPAGSDRGQVRSAATTPLFSHADCRCGQNCWIKVTSACSGPQRRPSGLPVLVTSQFSYSQ